MQLPYRVAAECPLILAPMAGVSEAPFRQVCRRFGADVLMTEFLAAEAIRRGIRQTLEGCEFARVERPIGIQIYGADPEAMAKAAAIVTAEYQPDFIDINFGCPVKKVVQRNGGSGCLRDLELVDRIIRAVVAATHLPVTVKTRSGWSEQSRQPVEIALRMQEAGARAFTLHARTRTQMFSGEADWDEIARVVEALDIPVIGNGDVQTADDVVAMRGHTGCAARLYAQVLCDNVGAAPPDTSLLEPRLAEHYEQAAIDFRGITPEQVETAAVRYYAPMLCPAKSELILRLFMRS